LKDAEKGLFEWLDECAKKPTKEEQAKCLEGFSDEFDRFIEEGFKLVNLLSSENISKEEQKKEKKGFLSKLKKLFQNE